MWFGANVFQNVSSFLDLRLQGVDVTCAALSCLGFASDVCPHVSLLQFLQVFDCKGLMSHVPHSAAFGLDQMCYAAGGSRRAPRPKAGVASRPKAGFVDCVFSCIVLASGG